MPDRTQDLKNLRAVAVASKNYIDKSIDNLKWELGTYDLGIESDNTSALVKTMPSGTILANVNKIYGASEVSENIMVVSNLAQTTDSGLTFSRTDAILKINGTTNRQWSKDLGLGTYTLPAGTYKLACFNNVVVSGTHSIEIRVNGTVVQWLAFDSVNKVATITLTETSTLSFGQLGWGNGVEFNNFQCSFMLVSGSTAPTEFKVGYTGIHNLELSGLKVEGFNIWDEQWELGAFDTNGVLSSGNKVISKNFIPVEPNKTYYVYCGSGSNVGVHYYYQNQSGVIGGVVPITNGAGTFTVPSDVYYIKFNLADVYGTTYKNDICINVSNAEFNGTYQPYVTPTTKTIDLSSILYNGSPLFEGNSLKAVGTAKDYITPYVAHKEDGNKTYSSNDVSEVSTTYTNLVYYSIPKPSDYKYASQWSGNTNLLSNKYDIAVASGGSEDSTDMIGKIVVNLSQTRLFVGFALGTTLAQAQAQIDGMILVYPLATPIEVSIDWSSTLRGIQGYSNGSITAQNTYDMAVSSEIDYLVEEVKA